MKSGRMRKMTGIKAINIYLKYIFHHYIMKK
jgi:hypothetical protein